MRPLGAGRQRAIGEGFGDYLAVVVTAGAPAPDPHAEACVADWDTVSYTSTMPHCLRRLDGDEGLPTGPGRGHTAGEIWSRALWVHLRLPGDVKGSTFIVEAQFAFATDTSFHDATLGTVAAAQRFYGPSAARQAPSRSRRAESLNGAGPLGLSMSR